MQKIACEVCGKEFVPNNGRIKCCSTECSEIRHGRKRNEKKREARAAAGKEGRRIGILREVGTCCVCGKTIEGFRSTRRYCDSEHCRRVGVMMMRYRLSVKDAEAYCADIDRKRNESKARREINEKTAAEAKAAKRCYYYGKSVPTNPWLDRMSMTCKRDGMINVCILKGRCPLGRKF